MLHVMVENRNACRNFKRSLGKRRCRWEGNIQPGLTEVGQRSGWIYLAQDSYQRRALLNAVMNCLIS
jgi:hypothetical protein